MAFLIFIVCFLHSRGFSRIFRISSTANLGNIEFTFDLVAIYFYPYPPAHCFQGIPTSKLIRVSGKILKLGDMQFNVKADNKVVKEDGTIESRGNGHKLTILWTIRDNGNSYEDADAAAGDMAKDMRVDITGSYEGKKFHAAQVQMMKFESCKIVIIL